MQDYERIEETREIIIQALGSAVNLFGLNMTLGRIFGLLYFSDEPLSLNEMAKKLMVSKATISINIRFLENLKCVHKVWKKGSRRDFYEVERDFNKIIQEVLRTQATAELNIYKDAVTRTIESYEEILKEVEDQRVKEQVRRDMEKISELTQWINIGEKWMNFFMNMDLHKPEKTEMKRINIEWEDE